jgi:glycosyltransferase involved in cell wall biosynthesis
MKRPDVRRIPIVFVIDNMRFGGTELNAVRTAALLDRTRFDLRVVCFKEDGPLADRYRSMGVPVVLMPLRSLFGPTMLSVGWRFARYLRRERVQIVHAHDVYSNVFATLWARVARTPVVIASRRWWHSLPNRKLQLGNKMAFRMADAVLANSPQVARSVREEAGVAASRVRTVTNFVEERAFTPLSPPERSYMRRAWKVADASVLIGCVARLDPVKDHASLVRATAALRAGGHDVHLALIGDGEMRPALETLVASLDLGGAVTFVGEVRDGENHHRAFDISALCSLSEGFPNTLVEAMAAGRPVVATAVGGSVDAVEDGVTGILVAVGRPEELVRALTLLVEDPALRASFGNAGRTRAREHYHASGTLLLLEGMYEQLLLAAAR